MIVAVIGLMVALLIPAVGSATGSSHAARAAGQMRQILAGLKMYAGEHNGQLPYAQTSTNTPAGVKNASFWAGELATGGYVPDHRVFFSGAVRDGIHLDTNHTSGFTSQAASVWAYVSFGVSRFGAMPLGSDAGRVPVRLQSVPEPSKLMVLADTESDTQPRDGWYWFSHAAHAPAPPNQRTAYIPGRYNDRANIGFLDGHVERVDPESLRSLPRQQAPWFEEVFTRR